MSFADVYPASQKLLGGGRTKLRQLEFVRDPRTGKISGARLIGWGVLGYSARFDSVHPAPRSQWNV